MQCGFIRRSKPKIIMPHELGIVKKFLFPNCNSYKLSDILPPFNYLEGDVVLEKRIITAAMLEGFAAHMTEEERSENTRKYYLRILWELAAFAGNNPVMKQTAIDFKE